VPTRVEAGQTGQYELGARRITEILAQLTADEIIEWNHIFDQLVAAAYTIDLMAACYLMNTGAGEDGSG
jgi:hypothetical protein